MEFICPQCHQLIAEADINIVTDLAKCSHCGSIHRASTLVNAPPASAAPVSSAPPTGSRIDLSNEMGETVITLPRSGISGATIPVFIFSLFWLSFVAFWTFMAAQASVLFAMFSIPFWFVGLGMMTGVINGAFEVQTIRLDTRQISFSRRRPIFPKTKSYELREILSFQLGEMSNTAFSSLSRAKVKWKKQDIDPLRQPSYTTAKGTEYFFQGANEGEQEWIVNYLEQRRIRGSR